MKAQESAYLNAAVLQGTASKVEFYDGLTLLRTITKAPFQIITPSLSVGIHRFYVKVFADTGYSFSNVEEVTVGSQLPYLNKTVSIPTQSIEAGNYDYFEGGLGQGVSYFDNSITNQVGNFRSPEYVDAGLFGSEGNIVEFIEKGEWLSYSVNIEKSGIYGLNFRYSSGLAGGGGPFSIAIDTSIVASNIRVTSTSNNWKIYANKKVDSIQLASGNHVLKLKFDEAGFNLGRLTFNLISTTGNVELNAVTIAIFPNPATDKLSIITDRNELLSVKVYNLSGLEIMHQNIETERRN